MKTNLFKLIVFVFTISIQIQTKAQARPNRVPYNGLVGQRSCTRNTGSLTGAVLTNDIIGRSNQSYSFDGNADCINCGIKN